MKLIRLRNFNAWLNNLKDRQWINAFTFSWDAPRMELGISNIYHYCLLNPQLPWEDPIFFPQGTRHCPTCGYVF